MAGTGGTLAPSPPKVKEIKNPTPTGPSVAAKMVQARRAAPARGSNIPGVRRNAAPPRRAAPPAEKEEFGLSTTDKTPFSALNSPYKTQGEFNKAVLGNAKTLYEPALQGLKTEEEGEKALTGEHQADDAQLYKEYSERAQQALTQARSAMAEIASRQNAGSAQAQGALQAALSNTGVAGLAAPTNPAAYNQTAAGLGNADLSRLGGIQSGILGERAGDLLIPGAGQEKAEVANRKQEEAKLSAIAKERGNVTRAIPEDIEKSRKELSEIESNRQSAALQQQLAAKTLGLNERTQAAGEATKQQELGLQKTTAAQNFILAREKQLQEVGLNAQNLNLAREKLKAEERNAKTAAGKEKAGVEAQRFDNGLQLMENYLNEVPKVEAPPGASPAEVKAYQEKNPGAHEYRKNAQELFNKLTQLGNLTAPEAYRLMAASGNGYIEQYAHEHVHQAAVKSATRVVRNAKGGKVEVPTYKPKY